MVDTESLTIKLDKDMERFKAHHKLDDYELGDILLNLGYQAYMRDMATRQLNGNTSPYLTCWHLRQGLKNYQKDLCERSK